MAQVEYNADYDVEKLSRDPANREPTDIEGLTESIRQVGIQQPLIITQDLDRGAVGFYRIIDGERRYTAAQAAGLDRVPCILRGQLQGAEAVEARLIANLHRKNLSPLEEAAVFGQLRELGRSQRAIAEVAGVSPGQVHKRLSLLTLSAKVAAKLDAGKITVSEALETLAPEVLPREASDQEGRESVAPAGETEPPGESVGVEGGASIREDDGGVSAVKAAPSPGGVSPEPSVGDGATTDAPHPSPVVEAGTGTGGAQGASVEPVPADPYAERRAELEAEILAGTSTPRALEIRRELDGMFVDEHQLEPGDVVESDGTIVRAGELLEERGLQHGDVVAANGAIIRAGDPVGARGAPDGCWQVVLTGTDPDQFQSLCAWLITTDCQWESVGDGVFDVVVNA